MKKEAAAVDTRFFDLFSTLSEEERLFLNGKIAVRSLSKGRVLYLTGDASRMIYLIFRGKVKLSRYSGDGREIILALRDAGQVCGEMAMLGWSQQDDAAEIVEEAVIGTLQVADMQGILIRNARFNWEITRLMGLHLRTIQRRYESLCFEGASGRIKHFIREQADQFGRKVGVEIDLKMNFTHQDIAKLTITSRQTVTSVLNELERNRVISYNRKRILIRDYQSLL
jgi:CRP-like cAMP-binding protein